MVRLPSRDDVQQVPTPLARTAIPGETGRLRVAEAAISAARQAGADARQQGQVNADAALTKGRVFQEFAGLTKAIADKLRGQADHTARIKHQADEIRTLGRAELAVAQVLDEERGRRPERVSDASTPEGLRFAGISSEGTPAARRGQPFITVPGAATSEDRAAILEPAVPHRESLSERVRGRIQKSFSAMLADVPNEASRELLGARLDALGNRAVARALKFEADEQRALARGALSDRLNAAINFVFDAPEEFQGGLARGVEAIQRLDDFTPAERDELDRGFRRQVARATVLGIVDRGQLDEADATLDIFAGADAEAKPAIILSMKDVLSLRGAIEAKRKDLDKELAEEESAQNAVVLSSIFVDAGTAADDIEAALASGDSNRVDLARQSADAVRARLNAAFNEGHGALTAVKRAEMFRMLRRSELRGLETVRRGADARKTAEEKAAAARRASDLEIRLNRGETEGGYAAIDRLFDDGDISASTRVSLTKVLDDRMMEARKAKERVARVSNFLDGRTRDVFVAGDKDDQRAIDDAYTAIMGDATAKLPDRLAQAVTLAAKTGVLPTAAEHDIRGALAGADVAAKVAAAETVSVLADSNPRLVEQLPDRDRVLAVHIANLARAGMPPQLAVERAEAALAKTDDAEIRARRARARAEKHPAANLKFLTDNLSGGFLGFGAMRIPDRLFGEFDQAVEDHFLAGGDLAAAQELALQDVRRVWAVTTIGGDERLMKFAPEAVYRTFDGAKRDAEWMREQLAQDLADLSVSAPDTSEIDIDTELLNAASHDDPAVPENVRIVADTTTGSAEPRTYAVMVADDFGNLSPMLDTKGLPLRWRPDFNSSPMAQRLETDRDQAVADARERRRLEFGRADQVVPERARAQGQRELSERENARFEEMRRRVGDGGGQFDAPPPDSRTLFAIGKQLRGIEVAMVRKRPGESLGRGRLPDAPGGGAGGRPMALPETPGSDGASRLAQTRAVVRQNIDPAFFEQAPRVAFEGTAFPPADAAENIRRGLAAVDLVIEDMRAGGPGAVANAMVRKGLRKGASVSFYWGTPGDPANDYRGGSGLSHLIAKHGVEVVEPVLRTIAQGVARPVPGGDGDKVIIEHQGTRAVLSRVRFGRRETWLLSGFALDAPDAPTDLSAITGPLFFGN